MNTIDLDTQLVTLTTEGAVATLTLNRPDARNALSLEMIAAMETGLEKIESGLEGVAVVILAGAGKSFCAGMDLKAVQDDPILMGDMLRRLAPSLGSRALRLVAAAV